MTNQGSSTLNQTSFAGQRNDSLSFIPSMPLRTRMTGAQDRQNVGLGLIERAQTEWAP